MDWLQNLLPIVVGAVVAGISALVKNYYDRRDARVTTRLALEAAIARRDFVKDWWEAHDTVAGEESGDTRARAVEELERAWAEACNALDQSQRLLAETPRTTLGAQLRSVLMLKRWRSVVSWGAVVVYYLTVLFVWLGSFDTLSPSDPDYVPRWQLIIVAVVTTILLRAVFGLFIHWVEDRRQERLARRAGSPAATPPPPTP
jgi:hypothetical protein